jgi:hypothetical protein
MWTESEMGKEEAQNNFRTSKVPVDFVARLLVSSLNQLLSYVIHERQYSGRNQSWGPVYGSLQAFGWIIRAARSISLVVTFCWPQRLGETIKQAIWLNRFAGKKMMFRDNKNFRHQRFSITRCKQT